MVFSGLTFLLLFFPITAILVLICRNIRWQNAVLLVASLVFYAWGEPKWILAMLAVTAVNYLCGLPMQRASLPRPVKRLLLAVGVLAGLGLLFYFKYAAFFVNTVGGWFGKPDLVQKAALPIGISFYTFQALTYTVDVYRGKAPVQKNPLKLLLYVSCFPQLIAGPIVQYADIAEKLDNRTITVEGYLHGFRRFCVGLAKKVLLANLCGSVIAELGMADAGSLTVLGAWLGMILYSLQIYFDFSAYSDMAIGIGRMLGFRYKENFNYPYMADSVTDFWRRWHISLSNWLRDYIYIPLGGNRKGAFRKHLNTIIVFFVCGLWHGNGLNFVAWGLMHGFLSVIDNVLDSIHVWDSVVMKIVRRVLVFVSVSLAWVLFGSGSLSSALRYIRYMFLGNDIDYTWSKEMELLEMSSFQLWIMVIAVIVMIVMDIFSSKKKKDLPVLVTEMALPARLLIFYVLLVLLLVFGVYGPSEQVIGFMYMDF